MLRHTKRDESAAVGAPLVVRQTAMNYLTTSRPIFGGENHARWEELSDIVCGERDDGNRLVIIGCYSTIPTGE